MKWKKSGLIFAPDNNYKWMDSHAAVPFAEWIRDNVFRVYFSSRDKDNRSFVGYVEIDIHQPQVLINLSENPIISPGNLGTFDDSGAMLSCIGKIFQVAIADGSIKYFICNINCPGFHEIILLNIVQVQF